MELPNMKCNKCGNLFNSMDVTVKGTIEYEGLEVAIFDCLICGKKTDSLQCDYID